jgi:predicted TPR repeat methyltransferase
MPYHTEPEPLLDAELLSGDIELTVEEMVAFAMRLHRENRLDAAQKCYQAVLEIDSNNANAMQYLGVLFRQRGNSRDGLQLIRRSISIDPGVAAWQNNYGNVLLEEGQFDDAAKAFQRCSELDSANLEVLNNLGVLYRELDRPQDAEASFRLAVARNPEFVDAHANLASLCTSQRRFDEAFSHLADALALKPADVNTRRLLVIALGIAGRFEEGKKACVEWVIAQPEDAKATHFLAAFGGAETPDRASDQFVEQEFDGFANSFDAKLAALGYRAPELVGEVVASLLGLPAKNKLVLDAGCGTGLCAPFLRNFSSELVGVDLSSKMLSRALDRQLYDDLIQSELVAYMEACEKVFDVVVSADTLCYFGKLAAAFSAVRRVLRPGGHWVFTVEAHTLLADFKLQMHGRYSHSRAYVETELANACFDFVDLKPVELRFESGVPVNGWLVSAR